MKRVFAILLTLCLLLSLAACGGDKPGGTGKKDPAGTTTVIPTKSSAEQMAGKYLLYHVNIGETEMNYFQISMSTIFAGSYLQLTIDGTVTGSMSGSEIAEGMTWDAEALTMTNQDGETKAFTLEDTMLKMDVDGDTMTFLKEGDPRLDDLPSPFAYLHDYIVANGTQDDQGHTVVCENKEGRETTMTAMADGRILWKYQEENCSLEMQLLENSATQSFVMYIQKGLMGKDYTCNATIETAVITQWDIPLASFEQSPDSSTWGVPNFYDMTTEGTLKLMLVDIWGYLIQEVGITMESLGFTAYNS